jgi:superfamily II DNA or RNA helicase
MSYFSDNYPFLTYPLGNPGLRGAQAGAIHSIAGHFSVSNDSALVVMPTGSGKTAVLLAATFVLRAERVLIITPSRLVREQISEGAATLSVLKEMGVLLAKTKPPKVFEVESKLASVGDWEALRRYDIVIATPNCTSPEIAGVAEAPAGLFDLVLIDEAHHSAAATWTALLEHFSKAKRILFTATPYRRDKKMIQAKSIYTYPLKKAFEDKIFGKVNFVAVDPKNKQNPDEAIAVRTEEQFRKDRAEGLAHVIMVRTDSKNRADELSQIYAEHTKLKLQVIHSSHSARFVKKTIERLRQCVTTTQGQEPDTALDGVICVNMMGEGFDFPFLKIAAIHTPHQSLAVTLQFIGRFARTSQPNIGEAHFLAVPNEIAGEAEELFHAGAIWSEIVPNLSEARVVHEQKVREVIGGFKKVKVHREEELDLEYDLGSITPFCHVKIFTTEQFVGFDSPPSLPRGFEAVQYDVNEEHHCSILLFKEQVRPRWTDYDELSKIEYDFILTYYDEISKHLFICSSRRASIALYDAVGEHYSSDTFRPLSLFEVNRVLHDLKQAVLFQVGMKNRVTSSNSESYLTKMGSDVKGAVSDSDCKLYHRGHVFLRGEEGGKLVTIGYSSSGKVWSSATLRVPEIIEWCKKLGSKLIRTEKVTTGTNLDFLDVGEPITVALDNAIAVTWNDDIYKHSVEVNGPNIQEAQLHDSSIEIVDYDNGQLKVNLTHPSFTIVLILKVTNCRIEFSSETDVGQVTITRKGETCSLLMYLEENHFHIYLSDFSRISGAALFRSRDKTVFSADCLRPKDWRSKNIDITKEFLPDGTPGPDNSIHGSLKVDLPSECSGVVIYDHGTGEIGDFVTLEETTDNIQIGLYHCKKSGGVDPGERVSDVYEVTGQVVKSLVWLRKADELLAKVISRLDQGSTFLKGDRNTLRALFTKARNKPIQFTIYCVQPGISASNLPEKLTGPMAAARDYVARSCRGSVLFITSM